MGQQIARAAQPPDELPLSVGVVPASLVAHAGSWQPLDFTQAAISWKQEMQVWSGRPHFWLQAVSLQSHFCVHAMYVWQAPPVKSPLAYPLP